MVLPPFFRLASCRTWPGSNSTVVAAATVHYVRGTPNTDRRFTLSRSAKTRHWLLSFDHIIGELLGLPRDFGSEGLRGLEINDKLELAGPLDGEFARICA